MLIIRNKKKVNLFRNIRLLESVEVLVKIDKILPLLVTVILASYCNAGIAQNTIVYLDEMMTACEKKEAHYYRTVNPENDKFLVMTNFRTGELKMQAYSLDPDGEKLEGPCMYYYRSGSVESKGNYEAGKKVGVWNRYHENGNAKADKIYSPREVGGPVHDKAQIDPKFVGGEEGLERFILETLIYPEVVREKGVEGKIEMTFVVNEVGDVTDVQIVKGLIRELDMEAMRVVKLMPKWVPGKIEGNSVKVQMNLPLTFKL